MVRREGGHPHPRDPVRLSFRTFDSTTRKERSILSVAGRRFVHLAVAATAALVAYALLTQMRAGGIPTPAPDLTESEARVTPSHSIGATPDARLRDAASRSLFDSMQVVSLYGNPLSADMGILGRYEPDVLAELLRALRDRIDERNGDLGVVGAFHIVAAVAQPSPGPDGRYVQRLDPLVIESYVRLAHERGFLVFLDLQLGRSDVATELEHILPFLRQPGVHLALDPEFAVGPGETPGHTIGSLSAVDIREAQLALSRFVADGLAERKILVVHQFRADMIADPENITSAPGVDLVIDMDGFGPAHVKRAQYEAFADADYADYPGIKLFLDHDPDLMNDEDILNLAPRPALVVYQ